CKARNTKGRRCNRNLRRGLVGPLALLALRGPLVPPVLLDLRDLLGRQDLPDLLGRWGLVRLEGLGLRQRHPALGGPDHPEAPQDLEARRAPGARQGPEAPPVPLALRGPALPARPAAPAAPAAPEV